MPVAVLLLLFLAIPLAELALIVWIGGEIGLLWTVLILVADAVAGSLLVRWQGRAAWRNFSAALQAGRPPAREVIDGALVLVGGALLLTPGFLTDVLGLALLLPPSRAVARRLLARRLAVRMVAAMTRPRRPATGPAYDVEATAVDVEPGRLRGPRSEGRT